MKLIDKKVVRTITEYTATYQPERMDRPGRNVLRKYRDTLELLSEEFLD